MLGYLKSKRAKSPTTSTAVEEPILTTEYENFLKTLTSEDAASGSTQQLPEAGDPTGNDAQLVPLNQQVDSPPTGLSETLQEEPKVSKEEKQKRSKWSWMRRDSRDAKKGDSVKSLKKSLEHGKASAEEPEEGIIKADDEAEKEQHEMSEALDKLNLAAVDNRVFSLSKETRELLSKFTLVLKDLVNGVPTAYGDLESLLTNSDDQLQRSYKHLPSWLQKLVKQLPSKMSDTITPDIVAAAAEKHGLKSKATDMAAHGAQKAGLKVKVPSLKDIVTKPGAVVAMLKAILNFLKLRFPAFLGVNVMYSLALFVLLLILWYCHKRGREVRLEKERVAMDAESGITAEEAAGHSRSARSSSDFSSASIPSVDRMSNKDSNLKKRDCETEKLDL